MLADSWSMKDSDVSSIDLMKSYASWSLDKKIKVTISKSCNVINESNLSS